MVRSRTEQYRRYNLMRYYGVTPEDWDAMFEQQGGRCALCNAEQCPTGRRFAVDHDHETGDVRGLLCYRCNAFVAMAEETPERRIRLDEYLEQN